MTKIEEQKVMALGCVRRIQGELAELESYTQSGLTDEELRMVRTKAREWQTFLQNEYAVHAPRKRRDNGAGDQPNLIGD